MFGFATTISAGFSGLWIPLLVVTCITTIAGAVNGEPGGRAAGVILGLVSPTIVLFLLCCLTSTFIFDAYGARL